MELTGKNIIGNVYSAEGTTHFQAVNPATTQKLSPDFHEATPAEIDRAARKSFEAFQTYRNISGKKKADFLICVADEIMALGDTLINRCMEETGLAEARLVSERLRVINHLKMFAALISEG